MSAPSTPGAVAATGSAATAPVLTIVVHGRPITQGSKVRTRWGMRDDNSDTLKPWRDNVRSAALDALRTGCHFGTDAVEVSITFTFNRPATHYRTGRNAHLLRDNAPAYPSAARTGDVDKLQRSCFDSLTDAGVWRDDAQVVDVEARKRYCTADTPPGAVIRIRRATP